MEMALIILAIILGIHTNRDLIITISINKESQIKDEDNLTIIKEKEMRKSILLVGIVCLMITNFGFANIEPEFRQMTDVEFTKLMELEGIYQPGVNYNIKINGHGTGLRPPTEDEWKQLIYAPIIAEFSQSLRVKLAPSNYDNSLLAYFPPIGNQDGEGSCVSWATGYYTKTFQEAYEHDWDLSGALWEGGYYGYPSAAYQDKIFSPDFIYHQICDGEDGGSHYADNLNLMENIGACTWGNMPYDPLQISSWPSEESFREAPLYRSKTGYGYMFLDSDTQLEQLKNWLSDTNLVTISIDAHQYDDLNGNDLWTTDTYQNNGTNHANTIVGYDDNFGPFTENGETRYGAFKVANSWGEGSWENVADGFYYISYEAIKSQVQYCFLYENEVNYEPYLLAVFNVTHDYRGENRITLGIGNPNSPDITKMMNENYNMNGGNYSFGTENMALDITEFMPYYTGTSDIFFMSVYDTATSETGIINSFSVEYYDNYASGTPVETYVASDTPVNTSNYEEVISIITTGGTADINVNPSEFTESLAVGDSLTRVLTIANTGAGDLNWILGIGADASKSQYYQPAKDQMPEPEIVKGQNDFRLGAAVDKGADGPDGFGYTWKDSNEPGGPVFVWEDISSVGTATGLSGDDNFVQIPLPFQFPFYGNYYTQVYVSTNGLLTFDAGYTEYSNDPIPDASSPNPLIAPFWDDLYGVGQQYYYYNSIDNTFIIQYSNWLHLNNSGPFNFQVYFYENGNIEFYYESMEGTLNTSTIGIENNDGTDGLPIAYNTEYIQSNMVIRINQQKYWLTVDQYSGVVSPGESRDLNIKMNATDRTPDTYQANINIFSNDPDEYELTIPTTLTVLPPDFSIGPDSLFSVIAGDGQDIQTFTIVNTSPDPFIFTVSDSGEAIITRFIYPSDDGPGSTPSQIISNPPMSSLSWLSETPESGYLDSGDTALIEVVFNSTGLTAGNYEGYIKVTTDAPDSEDKFIYIEMQKILANITTDDNENNYLNGTADGDMDLYLFNDNPLHPIEFNIFVNEPVVTSAQLSLLAWDIDWDSGERDSVVINGHHAGFLTGADGQWSTTVFLIPETWVVSGPNGKNLVQVFVDIENVHNWAVTIDWGQLVLNDSTGTAAFRYVTLNDSTFSQSDDLIVSIEPDAEDALYVRIETNLINSYEQIVAGTSRNLTATMGDEIFTESFSLASHAPGMYNVVTLMYDNATNVLQDYEELPFEIIDSSPNISVNPLSLEETLTPGDSCIHNLTICNSGNIELTYEINQGLNGSAKLEEIINSLNDNVKSKNSNDESDQTIFSELYKSPYSPVLNNVLIFRNNLAWGYNVNVPILEDLGANISIANETEMSTIDLEQYNLVLFESQQPNTFYQTYVENLNRFEDYLLSGGIIEFHCATINGMSNLPFPGGMRTLVDQDLDYNNYIYNSHHPIVSGLTNPLSGNFASHEAFENVPNDADTIVVNESGFPTTVQYQYGPGSILVTGMCWEHIFALGYNGGDILPQALEYSLGLEVGISWLTMNPIFGTVSPSSSVDIEVSFNLTGLSPDSNYTKNINISSNDPDEPIITVPVSLTVLPYNPDISLTITSTEGAANTLVNIPVLVDSGFTNVAMIDLHVSYDTTLIHYQGMNSLYVSSGDVSQIGNTINTVWVYSGTPMEIPDGDTLMNLIFLVDEFATPGQSNQLAFTENNNIGDPDENPYSLGLHSGTFSVISGYSINGLLAYCDNNVPLVSDTLFISGDMNEYAITDADGHFNFDLVNGSLILSPDKQDEISEINGFDLLRLKNHLLGITTLSTNALLASDCNGSGSVDGFDLLRLKNYLLMLPVDPPIATWGFIPSEYTYAPISANMINQNFNAYIYGDVTLNWGSMTSVIAKANSEYDMRIKFRDFSLDESGYIHLPIYSDAEFDLAMLDWSIVFDTSAFYFEKITSDFITDYNCIEDQVNLIWLYNNDEIHIDKGRTIAELILQPKENSESGNVAFGHDNYFAGADEKPLKAEFGSKSINLVLLSLLEDGQIPEKTTLYENYPNPFNPSTHITYYLKDASNVVLSIYNLKGQKVYVRNYGYQTTGLYQMIWNACDNTGKSVSTGIYLYQLVYDNGMNVKRMVYMK